MPSFKIDLDVDLEVDNDTLAEAIRQALCTINFCNATVYIMESAVTVTPLDKFEHDPVKHKSAGCFSCQGDEDDPAASFDPDAESRTLDVEDTVRHYVPFYGRVNK